MAVIEDAARSENEWVRARILKQDPPAEGSLLQIAERARDMAANSLGRHHPAYAVALQNLGLYYEAIENDCSKANELFAQARATLGDSGLPLAEGFYWLGIFHYQNRDEKRSEASLEEALALQRRALDNDDLKLADTLTALAYAKGVEADIHEAISLTEEALRIQRCHLPPTGRDVLDSEKRLLILQTLAREQAKQS